MKQIVVQHQDGNTTPRIAELLKHLVPGEETLIRFEKGVYRFDPEGCSEKIIPMGHLSFRDQAKHVVFNLENANNLTIDGGGSEFIFTDRIFPFYIRNGENVTIRNLTIDFSFSRYCQGNVVACDETGFELAIDHSLFRYSVDAQGHLTFHCGSASYSTDYPEDGKVILMGNGVFGRPPWDYLFAGDNVFKGKATLPTHYIETDASETDAGVRFTYRPGSRKLDLPLHDTILFCYEPRANINILMAMSRKIRVDNVVIYRGGGMGIVADHSDDVTIENTRIEVRPGRPECRSTTADGMFFTQCRGQVTVRGCTIRNTLDDALNIHGFYTRVAAVEGPRTIRVMDAYGPHQGSIPFDAGDTLLFSGEKDQRSKGSAVIRSYTANPDGTYTVVLTEDFPAAAGDILENDTRAADFLFENNEVCCVPHLRISDNGKIIIRNNRFEKINQILCCDLLKFWYESGPVRDLLIENNLFTDVPWGHNGIHPVWITTTREKTSDVRNRNVRIRNNRFVKTDGRGAAVDRTDGVLLEGNQVEDARENGEAFRIRDCTDVQM